MFAYTKKGVALFVAVAALTFSPLAFGHGGGLDSNGGHYDRKIGVYHFHRSVGPLEQRDSVTFDDLTGQKKPSAPMTDNRIRSLLIDQSLASYSGNCPCPYNVDRAGRRCGKRSAYSKPGGASPLCYASDVSPRMVDEYRIKMGVPEPTSEELKEESSQTHKP